MSEIVIDKSTAKLNYTQKNDVIEFFSEASQDYETWSKNFNMHFGIGESILDVLNLEKMLENTNRIVLQSLELSENSKYIADLGSGLGAVARYACRQFSSLQIKCSNLVPEQIKIATYLDEMNRLNNRIQYLNEDYRHLSISDNSMDGVYAVESECYAQGSAKIDLIREVHRILKPKAKFVVADCMIKVNASELPPFIRKSYNSLCNHWAFDEMSNIYDFKKGLEDTGFVDVKVEDYSMKVALSVMWVPLKIFQFILSKKRKKLEIKDSSWSNLIASFNAIILGLSRKNFSYYVISARKK